MYGLFTQSDKHRGVSQSLLNSSQPFLFFTDIDACSQSQAHITDAYNHQKNQPPTIFQRVS